MSLGSQARHLLGLALLERSRRLLRTPRGRLLAVSVGGIYAFIAMLVGQMLVFGPTGETSTTVFLLTSGVPWWNYPGLLVLAPNAVLALPFFATLTMALTAIGVGLGMAVALLLAGRFLRVRPSASSGPASVGTAAGLTPVLISLVTLGACCSTTAAATAGIGLAAQASGTPFDTVLANTWYLGVFQLGVLWVALLAQEQLVAVYGVLFGVGSDAQREIDPPADPTGRTTFGRILLRVGLLAGGVTWSLSMFAQWTVLGPGAASASDWVGWLLGHQLLAAVAILAALYPASFVRSLRSLASDRRGWIFRGTIALGGLGTVLGLPPGWASFGWHGVANEVAFLLGAGASWAPVAPGIPLGLGLFLRWGFEYLLVGGFAVAVAASPRRVAAWLEAPAGSPFVVSSPAADAVGASGGVGSGGP